MNLFVTRVCNYRCTFCFATFPGLRPHMPKEDSLGILDELARAGVEKVTFVGGEPTLLPWLPELLDHAKRLRLVTCVVTNASFVDGTMLDRMAARLDWLAVSIDSASDAVEERLGRGEGKHVEPAVHVSQRAKEHGIRTKLNTVVTALNWQEDFSPIIHATRPDRWKVFKMLRIAGENDRADHLAITDEQFEAYRARHSHLHPITEDNDDMTDSYVMIDPEGRIFQNTGGAHVFGPRILDVGINAALARVGWDEKKFLARGGMYDWGR